MPLAIDAGFTWNYGADKSDDETTDRTTSIPSACAEKQRSLSIAADVGSGDNSSTAASALR